MNPFQQQSGSLHGRNIVGAVATAGVNERVTFIRKTYLHLFAAIAAFAGLTYLAMGPMFSVVGQPLVQFAFGGKWNWLIFMGLFMGVSYVADRFATSEVSRPIQYAGLVLYVVAEAATFVPLLFVASHYGGPSVIPTAAIATLAVFAGLTGTVFITRKDFSFLRGALSVATLGSLGLIVASIAFGFSLGMIFSVLMVVVAAGWILFQTSQIMAHYHPQQYVAASLALFAAVALLFWYILRIVMSLSRD